VSYHPILGGRVLPVMAYDGEVPPKRLEISQVDLYERVGKSVNLGTLRGLNKMNLKGAHCVAGNVWCFPVKFSWVQECERGTFFSKEVFSFLSKWYKEG